MAENYRNNTERLNPPYGRILLRQDFNIQRPLAIAAKVKSVSVNARIAVFCLYFAGIHTAFYISLGAGLPIPYLMCGIAGVLAFPSILPELRGVRLNDSWPLLAYVVMATVVTAIAAEPTYIMRSVKGVLQLYYSLAAAICLYFVVLTIPRRKMSSLCLVLLCVMAGMAVLESFGTLREYFDSVGRWLSPDWIYSSDARDELLHGAIRTKVLSPEPSTAATSFFWVSMLFFWSWRPTFKQASLWGVTAMIMLATVRSPGLIVAIAFSFLSIYGFRLIGQKNRFSLGTNIALLALLTLVAVGITVSVFSIFEERFYSIMAGEGSFSMRITGALQFATDYVIQHPWIGTGVVGDLEMLSQEIAGFYRSIGMGVGIDTRTYSGWVMASKGLSNNIALHFVYFGGVGGLVSAVLLLRASWLRNRWLWTILVLQILAFSMSGGGYNSAPIWCIGASLIAAAKLKEASLERWQDRFQ